MTSSKHGSIRTIECYSEISAVCWLENSNRINPVSEASLIIVTNHVGRGHLSSLVRYLSIVSLVFSVFSVVCEAEEVMRCIEPNAQNGSSGAVFVGDVPLLHTTQLFPDSGAGDLTQLSTPVQVDQVLGRLERVLAEVQSGWNQCVKLNFCVTSASVVPEIRKALSARFSGTHQPAVSYVTTLLPIAGAQVSVDAVCCVSDAYLKTGVGKDQPAVSSDAAIVPSGSRIYVAGQAERSASLRESTRKTLESLSATMKFMGRTDADIIQLRAFIMPMSDAAAVSEEVTRFFSPAPVPPLILVEWQSSADTPIEIELVGWGGQNAGKGPEISWATPPGMTTSPVYSRVARIDRSPSVYVSGLYADTADSALNDPTTGEREVKEVFQTLQRLLGQAGSDLKHLAKATYYVSPEAAANPMLNTLRPQYYDPKRPPSASKAVVSGVGADGFGLTMDMIAVPVISGP